MANWYNDSVEFKSESITYNMKEKMQKRETVEEYLARGGKITKLDPLPNVSVGANLNETPKPTEPEMIRVVPWSELYEEADPELDDPQYWKKLNTKLDEVLKKKEA